MSWQLKLVVEWLDAPSADEAFGPERATWAKLRIVLGETCLTRSADHEGGEQRDFVVGGMSGLADWLVESWLHVLWEIHPPFAKAPAQGEERAPRVPSLRDAWAGWPQFTDVDRRSLAAWQHRHSFGHGASDIALPSIVFLPEDNRVGIATDDAPIGLEPSVRFAGPDGGGGFRRDPTWVSKEDLRAELERFVEHTLKRASAHDESRAWAEWLERRFDRARALAADPKERRRLMFGDVVAVAWDELARELGPDARALEGVLLDADVVRDEPTLALLERSVLQYAGPAGDAGWRDLGATGDERMLPAHERGYRLAERTRALLGEADGPLTDLTDVLARLGVGLGVFAGPSLFRSATLCSSRGRATVLYAKGHGARAGVAPTRFAIAAGLGRLLSAPTAPNRAFGAAHGPQARWIATRQANAFAAELLLPRAALAQSRDIQVLCEEYGISRSAAEQHRTNRLERP